MQESRWLGKGGFKNISPPAGGEIIEGCIYCDHVPVVLRDTNKMRTQIRLLLILSLDGRGFTPWDSLNISNGVKVRVIKFYNHPPVVIRFHIFGSPSCGPPIKGGQILSDFNYRG